MKNQDYIKKWLEGTLTEEERKEFENSEEYRSLQKILNATTAFKAPEFNTDQELQRFQANRKVKGKQVSMDWVKPFLQIAAVIALIIAGYVYFTFDSTKEVLTYTAEQKELTLPDASTVMLNARSQISFDKNSWNKNRNVELKGEAFFEVADGSVFTVQTTAGSVKVLGTEFNVKNRNNYFEVICYEGLVLVESDKKKIKLHPNHMFRVLDGNTTTRKLAAGTSPSWMKGESTFESVPFNHVIKELERQYDVSVTANNIDLNQHFTGGFVHSDLSLALKSITYPLHLKYKIKEDQEIILSGDIE